MHKEATSYQQNLPLVIGVDLGGTNIRTAVLQGSTLYSRVSLLRVSTEQYSKRLMKLMLHLIKSLVLVLLRQDH